MMMMTLLTVVVMGRKVTWGGVMSRNAVDWLGYGGWGE